MAQDIRNRELFERTPVPKALLQLALPTIASQLITMIYNLSDTFFIGMTEDPYKVAASSLSFSMFFFIVALAALWSVGGSTLVSRLLGGRRLDEARTVCTISLCGAGALTALYCLACLIFMEPLLRLMGASDNTIGYACDYTVWATVIGGVPNCLNIVLANLLRSEGHAKKAAFGLGLGSVLNIALDPLLMFVILPKGMEIVGASVATMVSNYVSLAFFIVTLHRLRGTDSVLVFDLRTLRRGVKHLRDILGVGVPSALQGALSSVSAMLVNVMIARYGDIPLAALGIVKKIDMLPMNISSGLGMAMVPLVAYNYAAANYDRMNETIRFARRCSVVFSVVCIVLFELFPGMMVGIFIREPETLAVGAKLLRICCLAIPLMQVTFIANHCFQAMGMGKQTLLISCSRQGLICIPLMFLFRALFGMYGIVAAQPAADFLTMCIALALFRRLQRRLRAEQEAARSAKAETDALDAGGPNA